MPLLSDVQRVAYFVAAAPQPGESMLSSGNFRGTSEADISTEQDSELALFRVATTTLDPEGVIGPFLETGTIPETDENGEPIYVNIATLITGLTNFDLQYFDGESEIWNASWEDPESLPNAVQILIAVAGETQRAVSTDTTQFATQSQPVTPSNGMTQSTMVYLPASATASGAEGGAQGGP